MPSKSGSYTVTVAGHREFLRLLRDAEPAIRREAAADIRVLVREIAVDARRLAPRRRGVLSRSISYASTMRGASVFARVPYAPVHEFGGTVWLRTYDVHAAGARLRPRRRDGRMVLFRPVKIAASRYMRDAAVEEEAFRAERYADIIDKSLRRL